MKGKINFNHHKSSQVTDSTTETNKKIKSKSMKDEVNFNFHKKSKLIPKSQQNNTEKKSSDSIITNEVNFNFHKYPRVAKIHPTEFPPNNTAISYRYYSSNYFQSQMIYLQAFCSTLLLCLIPQR